MAIEDLDLEFEDEEEQKKNDALDVGVDLTFSAFSTDELSGDKNRKRSATPKAKPRPEPKENNVRNISEAQSRPQVKPQTKPTTQSQPVQAYANEVVEDVAQLREEIQALRNEIQQIKHNAQVKIAVANAEKDYLVEYVSNAKLMDHQVTQVLSRVHKKVPALSSEMQTIKKYLNDFVKKSIPKKGE